jgi:hypothetical protein
MKVISLKENAYKMNILLRNDCLFTSYFLAASMQIYSCGAGKKTANQ